MYNHIWVICRKEQIDARKTVTVTEFGYGWFHSHKSAQAVVDGMDNSKYFIMSMPAAEEVHNYAEELVNGRPVQEIGYK